MCASTSKKYNSVCVQLLVPDAELEKRRQAWKESKKDEKEYYPRGFGAMYAKHVTQVCECSRRRFPLIVCNLNAGAPWL